MFWKKTMVGNDVDGNCSCYSCCLNDSSQGWPSRAVTYKRTIRDLQRLMCFWRVPSSLENDLLCR